MHSGTEKILRDGILFLGTPYQSKEDDTGNKIIPFGVDHDPLQVIKVVDTDQGKAIRISGVAWGMIYTEKIFQNYHLKLKVKWGEDMHIPRENGPRDSGLLYHGNGEPGFRIGISLDEFAGTSNTTGRYG